MIKHKDLSPWQCGELMKKYPDYELATGQMQRGDLIVQTKPGDNTIVSALPVHEMAIGRPIGVQPVLRRSFKADPWYWLSGQERSVLQHFNPAAEKIVNEKFKVSDFTETAYHRTDGSRKPWLPEKHVVLAEHTSHYITVHHPQFPEYSATKLLPCMAVRQRQNYMLNFDDLVMAVMQPELLKRLHWNIYAPSGNGTQHIYLVCDSMRERKGPGLSLYVPVAYFFTKDWSLVERFHEEVAVGYYRGTGFQQPEAKLIEWQEHTRALLTSQEAKMMRVLVEEELCGKTTDHDNTNTAS